MPDLASMTARQLLDAYKYAPATPWESDEESVVQQAPTAFAALSAALDLCEELAGDPVAARFEQALRETLAKWSTETPDA